MIPAMADGRDPQGHGGWTAGMPWAGDSLVGDVESELAVAARQLADARRIVRLERARVLKLKALGTVTPDHELTHQALLSTLAQMEGHAQALVESAKRFERPQRMLS